VHREPDDGLRESLLLFGCEARSPSH
jgi:hypothetical protein